MKIYNIYPEPHSDNQENLNTVYPLVYINEQSLGFNRYDIDKGKENIKWHENITATYKYVEAHGIDDFVFNILMWFIITEKFMKLLIDMEIKGIEFKPINVKCIDKDNMDITAYVVNVLNVLDVEAIDLENSKYFYYDLSDEEKVLSVQQYCLKPSVIQESDIFRIQVSEYYTSPVFITERVKKAIEINNITGCCFKEIIINDKNDIKNLHKNKTD